VRAGLPPPAVAATGTHRTALEGSGLLIAGRDGDVRWFATKDKFATYDGTAPIIVFSRE
jgi:transposase